MSWLVIAVIVVWCIGSGIGIVALLDSRTATTPAQHRWYLLHIVAWPIVLPIRYAWWLTSDWRPKRSDRIPEDEDMP